MKTCDLKNFLSEKCFMVMAPGYSSALRTSLYHYIYISFEMPD